LIRLVFRIAMNSSESLIEKYIQNNHFGKLIGMDFTIEAPGKIIYRITIKKHHLATPHSAHGGVTAALIDGALGVTCLSAVYSENKVVSTVEYKLNFLAPVLLGDELIAYANVLQKGKRLLMATCDVYCKNRNQLLVAKAMGTFNAYPAEKAGY
jgi:uncharacterized protein (TIGR00369 family)